jgi:hypothetical protein
MQVPVAASALKSGCPANLSAQANNLTSDMMGASHLGLGWSTGRHNLTSHTMGAILTSDLMETMLTSDVKRVVLTSHMMMGAIRWFGRLHQFVDYHHYADTVLDSFSFNQVTRSLASHVSQCFPRIQIKVAFQYAAFLLAIRPVSLCFLRLC